MKYKFVRSTDMGYLFIGIGTAGEALLDALLDYKEVRRAKPVVIKAQAGSERDTLEKRLKEVKDIKFAFVFSGLDENTLTPCAAATLKELKMKVSLVGVLPVNRRDRREELIHAYHSMENLKEHVNTFVIVDNQRIAHLPNFEEYYPRYNQYIASCLADLLVGTSQPSPISGATEWSMPIDRVIKTLSFDNEPGYVALSRASELTKGLWGYVFPFIKHKPLDLGTLLHVSLDKLSITDAPKSCDKSITAIRVPEYYVRSKKVDTDLIEDFMRSYSQECHLTVCTTRRNIAAVTNVFTYTFEHLERLQEIRGLANEGI
jgi:hypothetical protein